MELNAYKLTKTAQTAEDKKRVLKNKATRENADASQGWKHKDLKAHPDVRGRAPFVAKPKDPDLVPGRLVPQWTNELYDGAELRPFDGRPGAMDFKKYPSKGLTL